MKNNIFKIILGVFVFGLFLLIPLNSKITFGYTPDPYQCNKEVPDKVVLYEPNHVLLPRATGKGEVRLNWLKANRANKYSVAFGVQPGKYIYGATDVGNTNYFIVRFLSPGKKYYFAVKGVNDCMPGQWSREWSAIAGGRTGTTGYTQPYVNPGAKKVVPTKVLKPTAVPTRAR